MNVMDLINEVKDSENPYQEAMAKGSMFWAKLIRRHKANYFDAHFHDKETITDGDIYETIMRVAEFIELPVTVPMERAETIAEVKTSENVANCNLSYLPKNESFFMHICSDFELDKKVSSSKPKRVVSED